VPGALTLVARSRGELPLYDLDDVRPFGVDAVITTRRGGVSVAPYDSLNLADHVGDDALAVAENRRRVAHALGVAPSSFVVASQVHGCVVNDVDDWRDDAPVGAALVGDALVTRRSDVALAVVVADCVPLLVIDSQGPRFAVVHAGWRGLADGIIPATLAHFGAREHLHVAVGPHISRASYQVGPEVAGAFESIEGACLKDIGDRRRLDLGVVAHHQLLAHGVADQNIRTSPVFTDGGAEFFSDRAARPSGRFALVARRSPYDASVSLVP
jgi:YfiH family protein